MIDKKDLKLETKISDIIGNAIISLLTPQQIISLNMRISNAIHFSK